MNQYLKPSLILATLVSLAVHGVLLLSFARFDSTATDSPGILTVKLVPLSDRGEPLNEANASDAAASDLTIEPAAQLVPAEPDVETASEPPAAPPRARDRPRAASGVAPDKALSPIAVAARPIEVAAVTVRAGRLKAEASDPPARVAVADETARLLNEQALDWARAMRAEVPFEARNWTHGDDTFHAEFEHRMSNGDMDLDQVVATVSAQVNGQQVSTTLTLTRLGFSHFAQFIDRWDPSVQIHDDVIDGRFHSNSEIYIDHSRGIKPTFHGKVTTARGINTSNSTRRLRHDEVFLGGLETRARRIALPDRFLTNDDSLPSESGREVHVLSADSRIRFHADGSYVVAPLGAGMPKQRRALASGVSYLIATDKTELHVSGVVNGQVLVYSPRSIVIEGDLIYASDPRTAGADDYLGLASDRSVEVAEPDTTGPGDLQVHAAIYARQRFNVRRYRYSEDATLFIFGSLTAGSVSATEPRYATRLSFDTRFEHTRPPGFPMTDRYEVAEWDRLWTLAGNQRQEDIAR